MIQYARQFTFSLKGISFPNAKPAFCLWIILKISLGPEFIFPCHFKSIRANRKIDQNYSNIPSHQCALSSCSNAKYFRGNHINNAYVIVWIVENGLCVLVSYHSWHSGTQDAVARNANAIHYYLCLYTFEVNTIGHTNLIFPCVFCGRCVVTTSQKETSEYRIPKVFTKSGRSLNIHTHFFFFVWFGSVLFGALLSADHELSCRVVAFVSATWAPPIIQNLHLFTSAVCFIHSCRSSCSCFPIYLLLASQR